MRGIRRDPGLRCLTALRSDTFPPNVLYSIDQPHSTPTAFNANRIQYQRSLSLPVIAVGAAFDFHAGTISQAPPSLQRTGLEWAYRLSREPKRLWRRYALLNPLYIAMVTAQAAGVRRFDGGTRPEREMNYG